MDATAAHSDLLEDEPRFAYRLELAFSRSDVSLLFDKQKQHFLLTAAQEDGRASQLEMRPIELERFAIELLLAARGRLGLSWPIIQP